MTYLKILENNYPVLKNIISEIKSAIELLTYTFSHDGKLLLCGNGGSAADCEHIAGELMKGFLLERKLNDKDAKAINDSNISSFLQYGLPCIPLTSFSSTITAVANDNSADMIFAQSVFSIGKKGDCLLCLSTSGNSANIVNAAKTAKAKDINIISITGKNESLLSGISDITIKIPEDETYRIQELTLPVYHAICAEIEMYFYSDK